MPKKKSKRSDSRGYATTSIRPKPPSASAQKVKINSKTHAGITNLLSEITIGNDNSVGPTSFSTSSNQLKEDIHSNKFLQKITKIHENLTKHGFTEDQIKLAVQSLVNGSNLEPITFELVLDWLVVNLSMEELPALFIEGTDAIKDFVTGQSSSISVIKADPKLASNTREHSDTLIEVKKISNTSLKEDQQKAEEAAKKIEQDVLKAKEAQKAWLLQQYAYEEEEEEEDHNIADSAPSPPSNLENDEKPIVNFEPELSPEEIHLAKLESQLKEMTADLNDEAANYMRSKHEIKELKKQKQQLEGNVKRLRGRVEKQRKEKEKEMKTHEEKQLQENHIEANEIEKVAVEDDINDEDEEDEDEGGGMFSMFDEETPSPSPAQETALPPEPAPKILPPGIPKDWTGKTPYQILEEHCRKHRFSKPKYEKTAHSSNGCRIRVSNIKNQDPLEIDNKGPFATFKDAQHYLATEALYQLNPTLPLYRLFPPVFRDLWKSWLDEVAKAKQDKLQKEKDAKETKMKGFVKSISMRSQESVKDQSIQLSEEKSSLEERNKILLPQMSDDSWDNSDDGDKIQDRKTANHLSTSNGQKLRDEFNQNCRSKSYQKLFSQRKSLPMYSYRSSLLSTVEENPVTVLCGETGCGKTTQCPQFILEQAIQENNGDKVNIICTQPRRVAAMSVAERVAEEVGMNGGKAGGLVGYHIRMEAKRSDKTRLLFCTTGVILRRLQDDPQLNGVTHVVVDEVHERQWQIDFLLIALRKLVLTTRKDLKVLLMSATLDSKLFCNFFNGAPFLSVPGRTFPVNNYYLEDLIDATDHFIDEYSPYAKKKDMYSSETVSMFVSGKGGTRRKEVATFESEYEAADVSDDYTGYKMSTRRSMDRVDEQVINYDLIEDVLNLLLLREQNNQTLVAPKVDDENSSFSNTSQDGATLIFLPGFGEIRRLSEQLKGSRSFGNSLKFDIILLHSTLSPQDQRRAFKPSSKGCRKIILSTNIAETSVTIPDVTCVIDTGLVREVRQNERTSTSTLTIDWCSKASTKQRAGRAGRVQPGLCCKLYSSKTAQRTMKDQAMPELQRVPLEEVCLSILAGGLSSNCMEFLSQAPQPPSEESIRKALILLKEVGAIESDDKETVTDITTIEQLTPLGHHLAKLPVHVRLGKMLIFGCLFKCLDKVLTIAAILSSKSPFSNHIDNASQATAAHRTFIHPTSDFLTLCNVWEAYSKVKKEGSSQSRRFCTKMYLNRTALLEINDARRQFLDLLCQIGFVTKQYKEMDINTETLNESLYNMNGKNENLVNAVVCAGFYANVAHAIKEPTGGVPALWHKKERVYFHSSSVNHKKVELGSEWIIFHEKFATSRVFVSATSVAKPFSLLLFGGNIDVKHLERIVIVDDWIELRAAGKTGVMFRQLRQELVTLLKSKMANSPDSDEEKTNKVINGIVKIISHE